MCYVQIAGMLVATLVTLVIVPVLYVVFVEDLHLVRWETDSVSHQEHGPGIAETGPVAPPEANPSHVPPTGTGPALAPLLLGDLNPARP